MADSRDQFLQGMAGPLGTVLDIFGKLQPGGMPELEEKVFPDQFELLRSAIDIAQETKAMNQADASGSILGELFQGIGADAMEFFVPQTPQEVISDKALDILTGGAGGTLLGTLVSPQIVNKLSKGIRGELVDSARKQANKHARMLADDPTMYDRLFESELPELLERHVKDLESGVPRKLHDTVGGLAREIDIDEVPEMLFHVTTSKPGVKTDKTIFGMTGGEVPGASTGAGGAIMPGTSWTDDPLAAINLKREMSRLGQIHRETKKKTAFADFVDKFAKEDSARYGEGVADEAADFAKKHFEFELARELEVSGGKPLPQSTIRQLQTNAYAKYLQTRGDNPVVLSGDLSEAVFDIIGVRRQDLVDTFGEDLPTMSMGMDAVGNEVRINADIPVIDETQELVKQIIREQAPNWPVRPKGERIPAKSDLAYQMVGGEYFDIEDVASEQANRKFMEEMGIEFPESSPILAENPWDSSPTLDAAMESGYAGKIDPVQETMDQMISHQSDIDKIYRTTGWENDELKDAAQQMALYQAQGMSQKEAFKKVVVESPNFSKETFKQRLADRIRDTEKVVLEFYANNPSYLETSMGKSLEDDVQQIIRDHLGDAWADAEAAGISRDWFNDIVSDVDIDMLPQMLLQQNKKMLDEPKKIESYDDDLASMLEEMLKLPKPPPDPVVEAGEQLARNLGIDSYPVPEEHMWAFDELQKFVDNADEAGMWEFVRSAEGGFGKVEAFDDEISDMLSEALETSDKVQSTIPLLGVLDEVFAIEQYPVPKELAHHYDEFTKLAEDGADFEQLLEYVLRAKRDVGVVN